MKYSDILKNPHFNNLAAIIRIPHQSQDWREAHATIPFWKLIDELSNTPDATEFLNQLCNLLVMLTKSDERLTYSEADLAWFSFWPGHLHQTKC